jgi:hypothetical protein
MVPPDDPRARRWLLRATVLLALGAVGCGTSSASPDAGSDAGIVMPPEAGGLDGAHDAGDGGPTPCTTTDAGVCVNDVRGRVVDDQGQPLAGLATTVCGNVCFFGHTDDAGAFDVQPYQGLDPADFAVIVHARPAHAGVYVPLPSPQVGVVDLAAPLVAPLYTVDGPPLPDGTQGGTVTAGDITVTVPPGTTLMPSVEDVALGDLGTHLRVASVPVTKAPPFAAAAGNVVAVWALAPFELDAQPGLSISALNHVGMAAGSAVDFVVMGFDVVDLPFVGGKPVVEATGHVTADGSAFATDPGQRIQTMTWLAIRPHQ